MNINERRSHIVSAIAVRAPRRTRGGFTLIELLIVVAIIAILAAIAVPNFLEAQVRSKASRAKADIRSLATALESYRVDSNAYPEGYTAWSWTAYDPLIILTSPVAYITSVPKDPFFLVDVYNVGQARNQPGPFWYWNIPTDDANFGMNAGDVRHAAWRLASAGPDRLHGAATSGDPVYEINWLDYDPTNGTVSRGEIMRWGP
jgi:type II secretion system protein G